MIKTPLTKYNTYMDLRNDSMNLSPKKKFDHHKGVFSLFVYPNMKQTSIVWLGMSLFAGFLMVGCGGDQPRTENETEYYTDQSSAVFAPEPESTPADPSDRKAWERDIDKSVPNHPQTGGWSIVLTTVGQGGAARAQEMLRIIQDEAGLAGAYVDQRSTGLVIAYGDYLDKVDPKAVKDLKRVKRIDLMGVKLFEGAIIMPPTGDSLRGTNQSYDLRSVKARYGDRAVYTLQIGIYGRSDYQMSSGEDLAVFRKAAEEAARALRSQDVMAFYYHAPARSMVTVGVFGERDFDATTRPPTQSLALRTMREQFPNNLLNGQGINETVRTESGRITRLQSSQLVGIPEK